MSKHNYLINDQNAKELPCDVRNLHITNSYNQHARLLTLSFRRAHLFCHLCMSTVSSLSKCEPC